MDDRFHEMDGNGNPKKKKKRVRDENFELKPGDRVALKKKRRGRVKPDPKKWEEDAPFWKVINGVTYYRTSSVASALYRDEVAIRIWCEDRIIPFALNRGYRIFTKEQIEGMQAVAIEMNILYNRCPNKDLQEFKKKIRPLWP